MLPGAAMSGFCVPSMRLPRLLNVATVLAVSPTLHVLPV